MSLKIDGSELSKIPFIDKENIGGRALTCLTFHDGEEWHSWLARPDGVHHLKGRPVEADYFGRAPESETDVYLEFLNFMAQSRLRQCAAIFTTWEHRLRRLKFFTSFRMSRRLKPHDLLQLRSSISSQYAEACLTSFKRSLGGFGIEFD